MTEEMKHTEAEVRRKKHHDELLQQVAEISNSGQEMIDLLADWVILARKAWQGASQRAARFANERDKAETERKDQRGAAIQLMKLLDQRNKQITGLTKTISERNRQIVQLTARLGEAGGELAYLETRLNKRDNELAQEEELHNKTIAERANLTAQCEVLARQLHDDVEWERKLVREARRWAKRFYDTLVNKGTKGICPQCWSHYKTRISYGFEVIFCPQCDGEKGGPGSCLDRTPEQYKREFENPPEGIIE